MIRKTSHTIRFLTVLMLVLFSANISFSAPMVEKGIAVSEISSKLLTNTQNSIRLVLSNEEQRSLDLHSISAASMKHDGSYYDISRYTHGMSFVDVLAGQLEDYDPIIAYQLAQIYKDTDPLYGRIRSLSHYSVVTREEIGVETFEVLVDLGYLTHNGIITVLCDFVIGQTAYDMNMAGKVDFRKEKPLRSLLLDLAATDVRITQEMLKDLINISVLQQVGYVNENGEIQQSLRDDLKTNGYDAELFKKGITGSSNGRDIIKNEIQAGTNMLRMMPLAKRDALRREIADVLQQYTDIYMRYVQLQPRIQFLGNQASGIEMFNNIALQAYRNAIEALEDRYNLMTDKIQKRPFTPFEKIPDTIKMTAKYKKAVLICSDEAKAVQVNAAPLMILNAISNILNNAEKISSINESRIQLFVESNNEGVEELLIEITDDGEGFPADALMKMQEQDYQKAFSPTFSRRERSLIDTKKGGLGTFEAWLSVVENGGTIRLDLVDEQGNTIPESMFFDTEGNLRADAEARKSELVRGSRFSIRLPVYVADEQTRIPVIPESVAQRLHRRSHEKWKAFSSIAISKRSMKHGGAIYPAEQPILNFSGVLDMMIADFEMNSLDVDNVLKVASEEMKVLYSNFLLEVLESGVMVAEDFPKGTDMHVLQESGCMQKNGLITHDFSMKFKSYRASISDKLRDRGVENFGNVCIALLRTWIDGRDAVIPEQVNSGVYITAQQYAQLVDLNFLTEDGTITPVFTAPLLAHKNIWIERIGAKVDRANEIYNAFIGQLIDPNVIGRDVSESKMQAEINAMQDFVNILIEKKKMIDEHIHKSVDLEAILGLTRSDIDKMLSADIAHFTDRLNLMRGDTSHYYMCDVVNSAKERADSYTNSSMSPFPVTLNVDESVGAGAVVRGEEKMVRTAINNILNNAAKIESITEAAIQIKRDYANVVVEITDNGEGFPLNGLVTLPGKEYQEAFECGNSYRKRGTTDAAVGGFGTFEAMWYVQEMMGGIVHVDLIDEKGDVVPQNIFFDENGQLRPDAEQKKAAVVRGSKFTLILPMYHDSKDIIAVRDEQLSDSAELVKYLRAYPSNDISMRREDIAEERAFGEEVANIVDRFIETGNGVAADLFAFNPSGYGMIFNSRQVPVLSVLRQIGVNDTTRMLDIGSGWGSLACFLAHKLKTQIDGVEIRKPCVDLSDFLKEQLDVSENDFSVKNVRFFNNNFADTSVDFGNYDVLYYFAQGIEDKKGLAHKLQSVKKGAKIVIGGLADPAIENALILNSDFHMKKYDVYFPDSKTVDSYRVYERVSDSFADMEKDIIHDAAVDNDAKFLYAA